MLESAQFLNILAAEKEHLVTVSIFLPPDAKSQFERRLNDAFASDSFSDTAKAWNEERAKVVQEVLEQYLIPVGIKWTREYIREEVEDFLAARCGASLRSVRIAFLLVAISLSDISSLAHRCSSLHHSRYETRRHCICPCNFMGKGRPS